MSVSPTWDDTLWADLPLFAPDAFVVPRVPASSSASHLPNALGALSHLMYDEESPQEVAEQLRDEGNSFFRRGTPAYHHLAISKYTAAAAVPSCPDAVVATALANRAAVQLRLRNFGRALADAEAALWLCDANGKARWRAVRAAGELAKFDVVRRHCEEGLGVIEREVWREGRETDDVEKRAESNVSRKEEAALLRAELRKAEEALKRVSEREQRRERRRKAKEETEHALAKVMASKNVSMGLPLYGQQKGYSSKSAMLELDCPEGVPGLLWPVLVVYKDIVREDGANVEQSDYLECVSEDVTMDDIIATVFPEGAPPPPWDVSGLYSRNADVLVVSYREKWTMLASEADPDDKENFVGSHLGPSEMGGWKTVNRKMTLAKLIATKGYIVPMFPVIYVGLPANL